MFAFMILCFSFFVTLVRALPFDQRDVFNPPITSPNGQTVWVAGQTETVTWDITNIPPDSQLTSPNGMVVLGFDANNSLNLMLANPLAKGFKLRDGKVDITVPSVPPRDDYIVVVFGDSGNASPKFVIKAPAAPSSTSEPSTSAPGTPAPSTSPSGAGQEPAPTTSTLITTPIPITGSVITGSPTDVPTSSTAPTTALSSGPSGVFQSGAPQSSARSSSPLSASAAGASGSPPSSGALPRLSGPLQAISVGLASLIILHLI